MLHWFWEPRLWCATAAALLFAGGVIVAKHTLKRRLLGRRRTEGSD